MMMYQLIVLVEFDLGDLENTENGPTDLDYYYVVRIMLISFSFMFGVFLMNLLVAVLCVSHEKCSQKAVVLYERQRCHKIIEAKAISVGSAVMKRYLCCWHRATFKEEMMKRASRVSRVGARASHRMSDVWSKSRSSGMGMAATLSAMSNELADAVARTGTGSLSYGRPSEAAFMVKDAPDKFMWVCLAATDSSD